MKYPLIALIFILVFQDVWGAAPARIQLSLELASGEDAQSVQVEIPRLKFDKHMLLSYTLDDDTVTAYGNIFCTINRHWVVDGVFFHHFDYAPSTGYLPEKTLGFTDGAGVEKRFPFAVAVWPQSGNRWTPNFMREEHPPTGPYDPYLKWYEIPVLLDFGCSVYAHDTCTDEELDPRASKEARDASYRDPAKIAHGFSRCLAVTRKELGGRGFKVLMEPNGNYAYCQAARLFPALKVVCNQGAGGKSVRLRPLSMEPDFANDVFERRFYDNRPAAEEFAYLVEQFEQEDPIWYHLSTHRADRTIMDLLRMINDRLGKDGRDAVWFATVDEYYEYCFMRSGARIERNLRGNRLELTLTLPQGDDFHYQDATLLVTGLKRPGEVRVSAGENVNALSYAPRNGGLILNFGFNPELPERAERYIRRLEEFRTAESQRDARYFVAQLRSELRPPLEKRIASVELRAPIVIRDLRVEDSRTPEEPRRRTVVFHTNRLPQEYKACVGWLNPVDAKWLPYDPSAPIYVTLPAESRFITKDGKISVAVLVRDGEGDSDMVGVEIDF